jgi:3-hydroxyisobutyrate dehydrogenase-like beta-hydroxyacid dehydrogenase
MARNLIKAGHSLIVYNRTQSRAEQFRGLGAQVASSPADAAQAEAVITMLADDAAVENVILDPGNILQSMPEGSVHISMSTISVALSRRLAILHADKHQHYVAAPVFGRPDAAEAANLFVVVAGAPSPVERCRGLFDVLGQKTFVVGEEPAAANLIKLTGNFLITTVIEGLAEAFAVVKKSGMDATVLLEVLTGSLFNTPVYRNYGGMIAAEQFEPAGFKMPLGLKDNRLVLAAAEELAVPLPMASLVHDRLVSALAQGMGKLDWSAIARVTYKEAGL